MTAAADGKTLRQLAWVLMVVPALTCPQAGRSTPGLDDSWPGSTTGTRSDGAFVAGGWQVTENDDARFNSATVRNAAAGTNRVRLQGKSFCDDTGPFLGLGASYFQALRHAKYDRARLQRNLALFAANGFNYVRILSMVSWEELEIAPVTFTNRARRVIQAWPDYWPQFRDLLDLAAHHGLRAAVTIFADAQYVMPSRAARQAHLDGVLANLAGREPHVLHLEVANEAWQNGFPGAQGIADLRAATQYLADRSSLLVAITSNDDTSDAAIVALHRGSAADLATIHFSRDIRTKEGGWLPVRDSYRAGNLPGVPPVLSNEPIGPGSSVNSENDPIKLCAAAVVAYLANLPAYVYHSRAGVFGYERCCPSAGDEVRFEDTAGINAYQHLRQILPPDLASWTRHDGIEASAPFTVFCDGQPNRYWPDARGATNGCHRNIGSVKGREFVSFPMGILSGGVTLEARRPVQLRVFNPLTGAVTSNLMMHAGERVTLPQGPGAYLLKGTFPPRSRGTAEGDGPRAAQRQELQAAQMAERHGDLETALLRYETLYDATATDDLMRAELRAQFARLRPQVAPNTDPQKAGTWKVRAFAFRELDFKWTDPQGANHHAQYRYREDEIQRLRRSLAGFADRVWKYTDGNLRIDWQLQVVERPLTRLDGEHSFWPGPEACLPHLTDLQGGDTDTIMVFAKVWGDASQGEVSADVPQMLLGGALGALGEFTKHATYIGFNWGSGAVENEPDGEPMLHEWLHSAQWALEDYQGYPRGLMFTSDGGKMAGEEGGDPCYRRQPGEPSWMGFYEHLMRDHVTRRMWRELTIRRPPDNVWIHTYCRRFLVLGPFAAADRPVMGLDFPFINERDVNAAPGVSLGGREWQAVTSASHTLDLTQPFGPRANHVAYVAVRARSETEQPAQLRLGSDDGCKVWHNGRRVVFAPEPRGAEPDQNIVEVTLAKGDNLFLMKVANGGGGWAAILRLTDRQGGPLPGLTYVHEAARP